MPRVGIPWYRPFFPIKRGCYIRLNMLIWAEDRYENEKKKRKKIWDKDKEKRERKIEKKGWKKWKACDACPKIRLFKCWTFNLILCGEIIWRKISRVVWMEVSKAYKWWCNPFLWRKVGSELMKKVAALRWIGKGPDQSRVDHHCKISTLKSCEALKIIRSSSSCWYMASDLFLLFILILFDYNHQGVPRAFVFR